MLYSSLNYLSKSESFKEAVIKGIAPDKGLYYPHEIKPLSKVIIKNLNNLSIHDIAYESIKQFIGDSIPKNKLKSIIQETLNFDFPLIKVDDNNFSLALDIPVLGSFSVSACFLSVNSAHKLGSVKGN